MKFGLFRLVALPYFDGEGGGAPGAPASPAAPAAPAGGAPAATPSNTGGTPAAPAAQPNAQPAGFTYKEDRSNWVPSHVVRERSERLARAERELDYERRRVAALSGVQPPAAPRDPEVEKVRNQLFEVVPEFKEFLEMKDKLKGFADFDPREIQALRESQQNSWQVYGQQALRTLVDKAKEIYGADAAPKTLRRISNAFAQELSEDAEMRERYEAGDLSIIDEFIADYRGTILDPYRRTSAAAAAPAAAAARRLPRGGGSTPVVSSRPAPLPTTDPNFHKSAWQRFEQSRG